MTNIAFARTAEPIRAAGRRPVLHHVAPEPTLRREGIRWSGGLDGAPLTIALTFENREEVSTRAVRARVEIGAYGAFLPWRPLTSVSVPPIPPGGRFLVAASADNDLPGPAEARVDDTNSIMRYLMQMGDRPRTVRFAGNLNVFVRPDRPVERHVRHAHRLRPEGASISLFDVGQRGREIYRMRPEVHAEGWDVHLIGSEWGAPVRGGMYGVLVEPPAGAKEGGVTIWVERELTGEEVPVELVLVPDPARR